MKHRWHLLFLVALALVLCSSARADILKINDLTDTVTWTQTGDLNGVVHVNISDDSRCTGETCTLDANGGITFHFLVPDLWSFDTSNGTSWNFNIYEPGSTTMLSDTLQIKLDDKLLGPYWGLTLTFKSDNDKGTLTPLDGATSKHEDGTFQSALTLHMTGTLGDTATEEIQFASDVPDGGMSLMLLGGALVGLESLRRRFRA
jgi:hypothetical protein